MEKKNSIEKQSKANGATIPSREFVYQILRYLITSIALNLKVFFNNKSVAFDENEKNMANLIAINDNDILEKSWWDNNTVCKVNDIINKTVVS